ncbi:hypothetical protein RIF29_37170 [Crotalaria pallida]|uniref:Uncharacterized protein n=1 Tax=Crotalaria pallida TaxID=3830 RepID=A0AAN9EE54_CROPI
MYKQGSRPGARAQGLSRLVTPHPIDVRERKNTLQNQSTCLFPSLFSLSPSLSLSTFLNFHSKQTTNLGFSIPSLNHITSNKLLVRSKFLATEVHSLIRIPWQQHSEISFWFCLL